MKKLQNKLQALENKLQALINLKSSKAVIANVVIQILDLEAKIEHLEKAQVLKMHLQTGRRQYKSWIAQVVGLDKNYTFARKFLEPVNREFDRKGETSADFEITQIGIYHDSDGDYYRVNFNDKNELDYQVISYQEVKHIMSKAQVAA